MHTSLLSKPEGPGCAQKTIINSRHEVAAKANQILSESIRSQKLLSLSRRENPTHVTFSLASLFVGDFGSIVRIDVVDVIHHGHDCAMSGSIASQFIGDYPPWFAPLTF